MLFSSSPKISPKIYFERWSIELFFRDFKAIVPPNRLRFLSARLLVYAVMLLVSFLLQVFGVSISRFKIELFESLVEFKYGLAWRVAGCLVRV